MLSIYGFDRCDIYKQMEMTDILRAKNINVNQTEISSELASYNQMKAQNAELMKIFPVENKVVQAVLYRFELGDSDFNLGKRYTLKIRIIIDNNLFYFKFRHLWSIWSFVTLASIDLCGVVHQSKSIYTI